ncbi:hypothetical protein Vadar_001673 [Vaccinium darrowii]|uniref:Uncharacterized protein n=1 Tax=Vaccinium darrowii TaxID=229202 RepID=A0ACB7ZGA5_9ERIC|nr:hypothetical protein Vadar_001673 [Vaccinium darrowii]
MDHGDLLQGPIDPRLLVLQRQHRSHVVWEANGKRPDDCATIVVHRSEQNLRKLPPLSQPVIQLIRQAGFGSLLVMPFMQLDLGLLTALVERWRPETHTFHFPSAEATVTLQDVEVIMGLPINGRPVIGKTDLPWEQMVKQLLGCELPEEMRKGNKVSMAWLRQHFPGRVSDGATQAQIEQQARGYILHLIGGILAPDNTLHVHLCYLKLLEDLEVAGQYSWGSACLASLYRYLCHSSEAKNQDAGGMFVLLQVWAWERLPYLAPERLGKRLPRDGVALIGRWDDEFHSPDLATHVVGHYRHSLDMQRPDEVVWQPYSEELIESLPPFCRAGRAIWRAKVPLINFAIVEMHQPERVMRQFGFRQLVPPPSQARNALHGQTLKKGPQDWEVTNGAAVAMWNNRLQLVEPEGIPDLLHAYPAGDDYVVWYESITVPYVSRMSAAMAKATRLFRSLIRPNLPEEAQAIGKQGLVCMAAQEKFLRKEPPVHLVFEPEEGNEEEGEDQANFEPAIEGPIQQ